SPVTPRRWVHQNSTPNQLPAKTLSVHSSSPVDSIEFHTQLTSGQNNNKHKLSPKLIKPKFTNQEIRVNRDCNSQIGEKIDGGDDDGSFWRLSFGEGGANGEKIDGGVLKSVWYESDNELDVPFSRGCRSSFPDVGEGEDAKKFNKMVLGLNKVRELPRDVEFSLKMEAESRTPRRRVGRDWKLRKMDRRAMEEKLLELGGGSYEAEWESAKSVEKEALKWEQPKTIWKTKRDKCKLVASGSRKHSSASSLNSKNASLRTNADDGVFANRNWEETEGLSTENLHSGWQKLKETKIEELKSKSGKERKSIHVSRDSQRRRAKQHSKVRVNSPRTPSKVRVNLEN
ncbi:uncharacterized protein LOC133852516, partial [Alnus glutinosa]|uniref:uncharacterized protein LOC133852516 n=1 Tax=Alnus glutinosa TaxID=3517 RepID=UPI002D76E6FC